MAARMVKTKALYVYMNDIRVGKLEKNSAGGLFFNYDAVWLNTAGARPISLSLPLIEKTFSGDSVYNFFDNLLPDNFEIRNRIQSKFQVLSNHPFDILAKIGSDCAGALQILPTEDLITSRVITGRPLSGSGLANILREYKVNAPEIAIAGAQEKMAFLYHNQQWCVPKATTPTTHIFKLPAGDNCENEWLCLQIAREFGFEVANCELQQIEDFKILAIERFDRQLAADQSWVMRLPQEDMCQALGLASTLKYQFDGGPGIKQIMKVLLGAENPHGSRDIFFKAQVLFWLLCSFGHAKNFSIFIKPNSRYALTPLYDVVSAFPLIASKQMATKKIQMAMALQEKNQHYHWWDGKRALFLAAAKNSGYSSSNAARLLNEMLSKVDTVISQVSKRLPADFPLHISNPIFVGMQFMTKRLISVYA